MPPSDRHQQPLRLPHKVAEQLRRQAGRDGVSVNAYVLRAVKAQLRADGADIERDTPRRDRDRDAPQGLGLSRARRPEPEALPVLDEAPAPVVVQVNTRDSAAAAQGSLIEGLVAFVLSGPRFSQEQRKRQAHDVIKAQEKPAAERDQLAQQLEAALTEAKKSELGRSSLGGGIGSLFR